MKYGEGFNNWKKGSKKFQEHEQSAVHKAACAAVAGGKRTIITTFNSLQWEKQQRRRQGLISHLRTMKILLRQGIAIRGNTDSHSNIYRFNLIGQSDQRQRFCWSGSLKRSIM